MAQRENTQGTPTQERKDEKPLAFKKLQIRRVKTNIMGGGPGNGSSSSTCGGEGCCG